jgi:hypothetical protein
VLNGCKPIAMEKRFCCADMKCFTLGRLGTSGQRSFGRGERIHDIGRIAGSGRP